MAGERRSLAFTWTRRAGLGSCSLGPSGGARHLLPGRRSLGGGQQPGSSANVKLRALVGAWSSQLSSSKRTLSLAATTTTRTTTTATTTTRAPNYLRCGARRMMMIHGERTKRAGALQRPTATKAKAQGTKHKA